ncbi:MAG: hypothetical protein HOY75_27475 [Streptomyces sp.]|nr:hypothetical protein [Streptomyces sp.]
MCIRVESAPRAVLDDPWDPVQQLITIPDTLRGRFAAQAVRIVLAELDVPQPKSGARCWCGEPVRLLDFIPQQRSNEVINHAS